MKRKTSPVPTKIYTYGLLPPVVNADLVDEQLRLAKVYKNKLVEIELARRTACRDVMSSLPDVVPLMAEVKSRTDAVEEIRKSIKGARARARSRVSVSSESKEAIAVHKTAIKVLREKIKEVKSRGKESVQPLLDAENRKSAAAVRDARTASGLYWGTYLLVETAMEQARKSKTDPKFRRWDGGGRIGVQFQNGLATVGLSSDTRMQIGHVPREVYDLPRGERKKASRTTVSIRVGSTPNKKPIFAVFSMVMHRPLPEDAVLKWAWVKRTRVGLRYRYELQVVVESVTFARPATKEGRVLAVDIGWRVRGPDLLRVAYFLDDEGVHDEVCLPRTMVGRLRYCEDLRSIQDKKFDVMKAMLIDWLASEKKTCEVPGWLHEETKMLAVWRSSRRLAEVAWRWRTERFLGDEEIFEVMDAWRIKWRHLYQWECDQRESVLARRKDFYRNKAVELVSRCSEVVIEDFNLSDVAEKPKPEEHESSFPAARGNRQVAAVSEFRLAILGACASRGVKVTVRDAAYTTLKCHPCGKIYVWDPKKDVMHTCEGCGRLWDQDHNACLNLLSDFVGGSVASGGVLKDPNSSLDRGKVVDSIRDLGNTSILFASLSY
jgi:hypothetical protein